MSLPSSAHETAGTITGTITASAAPAANFTLQLVSSDPTQLTVPATVVLPAGQTSVSFTATLLDNHVIEAGSTPVIVTASTENWTSGAATVNVIDDDRWMTVTLPATGWEGQTLCGAGTIRIGGTLASDLVVSLASSDATQLGVPATVTIPAGQTSATFNVTLLDNGLPHRPAKRAGHRHGRGPACRQQQHRGQGRRRGPLRLQHDQHSASRRLALHGDDHSLRSSGQRDPGLQQRGHARRHGQQRHPADQPDDDHLRRGKVDGPDQRRCADPSATLQANGAGETGASNTFAVQSAPLASFASSTIASPQTANVAFPLTLTAKDANGYTITDYEGTVNLNGWAVGSSSVTNVLLLDQSVNHYLATALSTLGLNYTLYLTDDNFESALASTNPSNTLAIVNAPGATNSFASVSSFVSAGGRMIFEDGSLKAQPSLAATLDATVANSFTTPLPVYDWGGSSFFTGLTSPVDFAKSSWIVDGDYLQPTSAGTAVAGFRSTTTTNRAAVVVGNAGRTILDGFLFDDAVDATTIVQLAENEIRAVTAPIPISPTTATFVDGVWTGNITVSQAVSSMYLRISDGSGHASNSNAFTVAAASSSYVYQSGTLDGNLTGSSSLTKTGDGVLTLSGVNSYTGGTTVSSGTLDHHQLQRDANEGRVYGRGRRIGGDLGHAGFVVRGNELSLGNSAVGSSGHGGRVAVIDGIQALVARSVDGRESAAGVLRRESAGPRCGVCVGRVVVVAGDFQRTAAHDRSDAEHAPATHDARRPVGDLQLAARLEAGSISRGQTFLSVHEKNKNVCLL